jgi:hypothetical protein
VASVKNGAIGHGKPQKGRRRKKSHDLTHCMKRMTSKTGSTWITDFGPSES